MRGPREAGRVPRYMCTVLAGGVGEFSATVDFDDLLGHSWLPWPVLWQVKQLCSNLHDEAAKQAPRLNRLQTVSCWR